MVTGALQQIQTKIVEQVINVNKKQINMQKDAYFGKQITQTVCLFSRDLRDEVTLWAVCVCYANRWALCVRSVDQIQTQGFDLRVGCRGGGCLGVKRRRGLGGGRGRCHYCNWKEITGPLCMFPPTHGEWVLIISDATAYTFPHLILWIKASDTVAQNVLDVHGWRWLPIGPN